MDKELNSLKEILNNRQTVKPPAYQWQDLALRVVKELGIPGYKKSAVFAVCKKQPKHVIERCLNETKELSKGGQSWRYFFKLLSKF